MKNSDAHAFVMLTLQDYLNTLPKSSQLAMKDKLEAAMAALAPAPDPNMQIKEADGHG